MSQSYTKGIPVDTDSNLTANSDLLVASQKATKTYIASQMSLKQDAINLTTTGTSGPATLVGNTLNIPEYAGGGFDPALTLSYIATF